MKWKFNYIFILLSRLFLHQYFALLYNEIVRKWIKSNGQYALFGVLSRVFLKRKLVTSVNIWRWKKLNGMITELTDSLLVGQGHDERIFDGSLSPVQWPHFFFAFPNTRARWKLFKMPAKAILPGHTGLGPKMKFFRPRLSLFSLFS